ncbi:hypothetical protein OE88DRAFT_1240586 [Heliocybe sulcata]|uniref:DUF6697 domain-containing protein n=1 Tax=Heliocybe sulcata TaxID=5364 RepID=A0A5C3N7V1_9AGAM|nr:hypothetical protein OE88DRAFT_1240586 [Heliocybe sulcata]
MPDEKKIKIEEEVPRLSRDSISARLAVINYAVYVVELEESIKNATVSRQFMTSYYGGNTQSTFPSIAPSHLERHGLDDFMYVTLSWNPYAPKFAGDSGFWFNPGLPDDNQESEEIHRVFVRLAAKKWLYVGQYKLVPALPLTIEEWKSQGEVMKRTWAEKIHRGEWARDVRAIVWSWKTKGQKPTKAEMGEAIARKDKYSHISPDDIRYAFDEGRLVVLAWCMKCVSYAEDFQRYIAREFAHWVPPPPKSKKRSKKKLLTSTSREPNTGQKRKRAHSEDRSLSPLTPAPLTPSPESEGETESEDGSEGEEATDAKRHIRQYVPRGTRSRPSSMKTKTEDSGSPAY